MVGWLNGLSLIMPIPRLIDSHCHLHFPAYEADRAEVMDRMHQKGIWGITVGTNVTTSASGVAFAEQHEGIFATVGYHPEHLTSSFKDEQEPHDEQAFDIDLIAKVAKSGSKEIVAIGETGLDFYRIDEGRDVQEAAQMQEFALREHIALADELNLPLVIHCRDAFGRLATIIQDEQSKGKKVRGVIHCFTGIWEEGKALLDLGFYLSFTGVITFPPKKTEDPSRSIHRTIEKAPADRVLVETDAPWLTPLPFRGKRNEPTYVEYTAQKIAQLRHASLEDVAKQTTKNAIELFQLPV
jgi:TatD DNase family protein